MKEKRPGVIPAFLYPLSAKEYGFSNIVRAFGVTKSVWLETSSAQ